MISDFEAAFGWEQVQEREAQGDFGVEHRAMLAMLTRSSQQLIEGFREDYRVWFAIYFAAFLYALFFSMTRGSMLEHG